MPQITAIGKPILSNLIAKFNFLPKTNIELMINNPPQLTKSEF